MPKKVIEKFLYVIVIATILLVLTQTVTKQESAPPETVSLISDGWYYMEGGEKQEITLPATIHSDMQELILCHDTIATDHAGNTLYTKGALYKLKVVLDDQILYEYEDAAFPRNDQMSVKTYCNVKLPNTSANTLTLHYQNTKDGVFQLDNIHVGNSGAIFREQSRENIANFLFIFAIFTFSITVIAIFLYFYKRKIYEWRLFNLATFLFLCGAWSVTDSSMSQLLSGNMSSILCYCSFYAFMLLSIPMIQFVRNFDRMKHYKIFDVLIAVFCINIILQSLLNYSGLFHFIDMLPVTHIIMAVGVITITLLLIKEYRLSKADDLRTILIGFASLGTCALLTLLLYWALRISYYELIFEIGILIFVITLFFGVIKTIAETFRYKTEMLAYERLSAEDRLTGLRNRKAYNEFLDKMEQSTDTLKDALLIFLDVKGLKKANDQYGHIAGDEIIVTSAICIENVFASVGNCYRIGGDEFCIIILNPTNSIEDWKSKLDIELRQHSKGSKYWISFIWGTSFLRNADGTLKSISDWKYEANQNLHTTKNCAYVN